MRITLPAPFTITAHRHIAHLFALLAFAVLAACGGSAPDAPTEPAETDGGSDSLGQLTIGTNPAGTHTYAVAGGLAKLLQDTGTARTTIRPFSGSSVYLPQLQRGEMAIGLNTGTDSYVSYHGLPPWDTPMTNLRALGAMFPLLITYLVRADSDIHTVEDLRGKRVVVTFRANASLAQLHEGILQTGGLTLDDITPITVAGLPDAMRMLTEGRADAAPTGINTALVVQVDSSVPEGVRAIQIGRQEAMLSATMPGTGVVEVEPDANSVGIEEPTRVAGVPDFLNASTHLSDDDAYAIISTIHRNWESLRRDYSQLRRVTADEVLPDTLTHPFHPGAIRYWREIGLWTEAHDAQQTALLALHSQ